MNQRTRIAIVGPGAIGTTLAAFLGRSGAEIELVGRRPGRASVRGGPFRAPSMAIHTRASGPCDIVFICVKANDTRSAIRRIAPKVGPKTAVVSLQNGFSHRRPILKAFGRARCVFGVCVIGAERLAPGKVRYHGGRGVALARLGPNADKADLAARLLRKAGLDVTFDGFEDRLLWTKAAFNAATNPLGALTGMSNGELANVPALRELMLGTLRESVTAAKAAEHPLSYKALSRRVVAGLASMPEQRNSMLQDLCSGRRSEIDSIVKPILDSARRTRVATPLLDSLYRFTRRLEKELA